MLYVAGTSLPSLKLQNMEKKHDYPEMN